MSADTALMLLSLTVFAVAVLAVVRRIASTEIERARREQYRRNVAERRRSW